MIEDEHLESGAQCLTGRARPVPEPRVVHRPASRRRYRYRRRHTPHYFFVLPAVSAAAGVCLLYWIAYLTRSIMLAEVAFAVVLLTALAVCVAYFWGFYMLMKGSIPQHRLKILIPHAGVGTLSPLLYTLNICFALDGLGSQPVTIWMLIISLLCLTLLGVQFTMGKALVRTGPLRVIKGTGARVEK